MVNDPSHQCLGLALPGTSGPEGLTDARKAGHVQMLAPGATQGYDIEAGALCGETVQPVWNRGGAQSVRQK